MKNKVSGRALSSVSIALLAVALLLNAFLPANATHQPADKAVATGNKVEVISPSEDVALLTATMKTSTPTDLAFLVTAECALTTNVTTVGNDDSRAQGVVRLWITIDGRPVGINNVGTSSTTSTPADDGKVTFCNRAYQRTTSGFDDEDATIKTFFDTRDSNAFNWVALNVGNGVHKIVVHGELTATATNKASALAAVGHRTLVVLPQKMANDASV